MIDFRYHVISLVSVFLALAVGIVLGAGPLNEGISTGITDQVRQLTEEREQLRAERDEALAVGEAQDAWAEAVAPAVVERQLGGRAVAVVQLPGADASTTDAAVEVLREAGATVPALVTVQDDWTDEAQETARQEFAADFAQRLADGGTAASGEVPEVLAAALARALVTGDLAQTVVDDPARTELLTALADAGLVEVDGEVTQRSTLALLVAGPPDADASDAQAEADTAAWAALAEQLDERSAGAVLAGPTESVETDGAVAAVRAADEIAEQVSTVGDLDTAIGRVNVVLALREQLADRSGHYGTGLGATSVSPPLPSALVNPSPAPVEQ
ncbi:copper transporter [Paenibacillus sp. TRM 82003]|uniref:copper transporter n=1 Tax=Kineococcus sp. TRM81007 TaxID=2925831 RepID=UPI001F562CFC|nr:copper transporter [Kineococcus sp. TRM81007]MCI2240734.1 copper transporter [Kineococcus sp. TRM81007]MCI3925342.1 copper transporter [Paenibacillus sp. TRM 82003]